MSHACIYSHMSTMSKLKRKKTAVDNCRQELQPTIKKTNQSLQESCSKTSAGSSGADGVLWWDKPDLNDVERIWAVTLKALCPALQTPQEERLAPLPPPSSTLLQKAPVEAVGDWKWINPDDVTDIPDLPAPSFLIRPPPRNDPTSYSPAVKDTVESEPAVITNQELSPNEGGKPVCDLHTTKPGAEGSGSKLKTKSEAGGSGSEPGTSKSGVIRSGFDLKKSEAGGSGSEPGTSKSGVIRSGFDLKKSETGGSGSKFKTKSGAGGSGSKLKTKSKAGGSESEPGTSKSGIIRSGFDLKKSEAGGSGSNLRTKSEAGGSESGLGTKPGGSGLHSKTNPGAEGSKLGLECCPMCLMSFPAGFSQLECDGHLAQCLSEMSEDIVW